MWKILLTFTLALILTACQSSTHPTTCDATCTGCSTELECPALLCHWDGKTCDPTESSCDASDCRNCETSETCSSAGCTWVDLSCKETPTANCGIDDCTACDNPGACDLAGCHWDTSCTPTPTNTCDATDCEGCKSSSLCLNNGSACKWSGDSGPCVRNCGHFNNSTLCMNNNLICNWNASSEKCGNMDCANNTDPYVYCPDCDYDSCYENPFLINCKWSGDEFSGTCTWEYQNCSDCGGEHCFASACILDPNCKWDTDMSICEKI